MLKETPRDPETDRKKAIRAVDSAFKYFGLDHRKPADWDRLRAIVLERRRGRPKGAKGKNPKWNELFLSQLGANLSLLVRMHPESSDVALAKLNCGGRITPETLRKRFAEARRAYERALSAEFGPLRERAIRVHRWTDEEAARFMLELLPKDFCQK